MEKIVVLMSTYNGEKYLREQLDSIFAQSGVDVLLFVRDDGSLDKTVNIINDYRKIYPKSIYFIQGENIGFAKSFSVLVGKALEIFPNIEYFAFSDQDDVWLENKLREGVFRLQHFDKDRPNLYCSALTPVDMSLKPLNRKLQPYQPQIITKQKSMIRNYATGCTIIFNQKAALLYAKHPVESLQVHDWNMFQMCAFIGNVYYDPDSHILYRQHSSNQIGANNIVGRMRKRMRGHFKDEWLLKQNQNFLNAFRTELSEQDVKLIENFTSYKVSLRNRIRLIFNRDFSFNSFERNFFFILKIILGKV